MADYKWWVDLLAALLTPAIAVTTTYIGVQQYRTNKTKLRVDLYDRRMSVYRTVREHLARIAAFGKVDREETSAFLKGTAEAEFPLIKKIAAHLKEIYKKSMEMFVLQAQREAVRVGTPERIQLEERYLGLVLWMMQQEEPVTVGFRKYLQLS